MYFKYYPVVNYKIGNEYKEMLNIVLSNNAVDDIYNEQYFDTMVIQEQSPEELSFDIYGDTQYYWVLLYVNKIVNPFEDWVITTEMLDEYCKEKYGSYDEVLKPKYFTNLKTKQIIVGVEEERIYKEWEDTGEVPINYSMTTIYEYEQAINDRKRYIRYVPVAKLLSFVDLFESAIKEL